MLVRSIARLTYISLLDRYRRLKRPCGRACAVLLFIVVDERIDSLKSECRLGALALATLSSAGTDEAPLKLDFSDHVQGRSHNGLRVGV